LSRNTPLREIFEAQNGLGVTHTSTRERGVIVSVTDLELVVRFSQPDALSLPVGKETKLKVELEGCESEQLAAVVIHRSEHRECYKFRLRAPAEVAMPNRRRRYRVPCGGEVYVTMGAARVPVHMLDISGSGIGLLVSHAHQSQLLDSKRCEVGLTIAARRIVLEGVVLYRQRVKKGIKLGIEFVLHRDDRKRQRLLESFIMERQRTLSRQSLLR